MTQSACSAARARVAALLLAGLAAGAGLATPYWVACEGDDFPENQGWTRIHGAIPATRSLADGSLVIDSRADETIFDYYRLTLAHPLDPAPGEMFRMRWRLKVHDVGFYDEDPAIRVTADDAGSNAFYSVMLVFSVFGVHSAFEGFKAAPIERGVFHEYEFDSADMRSYQLRVDGTLALEGDFTYVAGPTSVTWGDEVWGASSLASWDYVRFGVIPEPPALGVLLAGGVFARRALSGWSRRR
jgi:hypothetical protein